MSAAIAEPGRGGGAAPMPTGAGRQPTLLELMSLTDWSRFVPETLGLLAAIAVARGMLGEAAVGPGSMPHPFWIPVLLMSAQYGIMGGLFAVLAAAGAYFATELPVQSASQDFYDYAAIAAAQPCAWFAAALVLGGLRTLHMHHYAALEEQLCETKAAADDLAESLGAAICEIGLLERRIGTDTATTAALLDALVGIDLSSCEALLATAPAFVRLGTGYASVSFEPVDPNPAVHGSPRTPPSVSSQLPAGSVRVPLSAGTSSQPLSWLVCAGLSESRDAALAARRLLEVCRVLDKLVCACPDVARASVKR
jgi:hypothetical protein